MLIASPLAFKTGGGMMVNSGNRFPLHSSNFISVRLFSSDPISRRIVKILSSLISLLLCSIFFLVGISPVTALDWTIETVDSDGDVGWYTSLALDELGNPRISYYDWTNSHLKFAQKNGTGWICETVDTTNSTGEYSSLKLDNSGQPFISYFYSTDNLKFAQKIGDNWTNVIVDSGNVGRHTSLAIDDAGNPRISYQEWNAGKLKYAQKNGNNWTNETVDSSVNVGAYSSLALDSSGYPYISYYDAKRGYLKYTVKIGGQWINQIVDNNLNVGSYTSLALNGTGNPSISYYDGFNKSLKYATKTGISWTKEIVDSEGDVGKHTSLVFDRSGNPHIIYYDVTSAHLKYATKTGKVWTNETVDPATSVGTYSSLALNSEGVPRISYRDNANSDLKYATGIPPLLVNFSASSREGTTPLIVEFTDTSTGGLPSFWNWSFGDGTWYNTSNLTLRNPEHVYVLPGIYNVNLTIRNFSATSTLSHMGYIIVVTPSVTPILTPTATPTPDPTPTPEPTLAPDPTISPTPSPTPTPETTPSPDPTISPAPSPTPTTDPTPYNGPTLSVSPGAGDGGGDDILPGLSTTPYPVGEEPFVYQTVNVGGDSAIRRVTVAGKNISGIVVTGKKLESIPSGFPKLPIPVYQYVDVKPAQFSVITDVHLEFDIPLESMGDENITQKEVGLYLFQNDTWVALPTYATGIKNGRALYRAGSTKFSLFAITINNTPFIQTQDTAFTIIPESDTIPKEQNGESVVPVFINLLELPPSPDSSESEHPFQSIFSGIMVISVIVVSIVLIRHWWIQRQNPP
jgi:PGF-pre-PGF domain-containing protein